MTANTEVGRLIADEDFEGALSVLDDAISKSPETATPYKTRSQVFRYLGRTDQADEDLRRYVSLITPGRGLFCRRLKCDLGFHVEIWQYDHLDSCVQTGYCERCSTRTRRTALHIPVGEWRYREVKYVQGLWDLSPLCEQFRNCSRCGKPAEHRTFHQWNKPIPGRTCTRCKLEDEGPSGVFY